MKTLTPDEITKILAAHALYLGDKNGERADLYGANLRSANLYGADLYGADLRSADLRSADLRSADLRSADLYGANLYGADLRSANLRSADLYGANLRSANLYGANLRSANLYGADLRSADLTNVDVSARSVCPPAGAFTAFKKVVTEKGAQAAVLELLIPAKAARVSALTGRKCRAGSAKVVRIVSGPKGKGVVYCSSHNPAFKYRVGRTVKTKLDPDRRVECTTGIHFFMEQSEAETYSF